VIFGFHLCAAAGDLESLFFTFRRFFQFLARYLRDSIADKSDRAIRVLTVIIARNAAR